MERDSTLATIDDITEEEANITMPEVLPSSSGMSTSSSEYSNMAGRLLKYRSRGYRKRLSRSMEQISASSHSAQTSDKEESDDDDSLASCNVFGSQADQIKFLKDSLLQSHKELENYKIINADLTKKLERCKKHRREVEKMLENCLWEKLKLYNKYRKLQRRFDVPETPPGGWEDSSPSDSSGGPGNAGRAGTPVRGHRKRRGDSPAGHRDGAGPSKRPTTVRCGLDRQMESDSNVSSADELSDSGFSMADVSRSAKSCYESDADGSSSRSDSQRSHLSAVLNQDDSSNPDHSDSHGQLNNDVPSRVSTLEDEEQYNEVNIVEDDEVANDETADPDLSQHDNDINPEEDDVGSIGTRRTSASREEEHPVDGPDGPEDTTDAEDGSLQSSNSSSGSRRPHGPEDTTDAEDGSLQSSNSTSGSRKRSRSSVSVSLSDGDSGGSKRRKSSSPSTDCSGSTSRASSTSSDSVRRSPSRSPSPPDFADAPRIIPPIPDGSPEYPRYWTRNGNRTSLRSSVRVNYNDDDYFNLHLRGLL